MQIENNINNRDCYCDTISSDELEKNNIPKGYCGICEICDSPGHVQQHPCTPSTGSWCDECIKGVKIGFYIKRTIFITIVLAGIAFFIFHN